MKSKNNAILAVLSLLTLVFLASYGTQKVEWRGKIEYENGLLYVFDENEEDDMEYIKRYKIKNWNQIKERL